MPSENADVLPDGDWLASFRRSALKDQSHGARLSEPQAVEYSGRLAPRSFPRTIWIYWAQGWDQCPQQSRQCLESWIRWNSDWRLIQLDDTNLSSYIDLGTLLETKDISFTAKSDLVRTHLLASYGGVWVDASTFCSLPLSGWLPPLMQSGFFAFFNPGRDRLLSTWFLAAEPRNPLILHWRNLQDRYWKNIRKADFYFWSHYLFAEGCRTDPAMHSIWHQTPKISADGPHEVQANADNVRADDVLRSIIERRSPVHKLETRRAKSPVPSSPLARLLSQR